MHAVPRLSIGLPVYNGANYLAESLDALLGQTYEDFELIISDNASTDGTATICRKYCVQDPRLRYIRQPHNIGSAANHNFVFQQAQGQLFKWAAADDLYARDLLQRCVGALDEHPDIVLAHSWTAAIDDSGNVTQALEYPLATDSLSAPERFRSMLFGSDDGDDYGLIRADDEYGVIRAEVLRKIPPQGSYYHSDRTLMAEIALHGPFHQSADWLYFRRDHGDRPQHSCPTVRAWCAVQDPARANRLLHPTVRLLAEYVYGYARAIRRAPITPHDRQQCYRHLTAWLANRALPVSRRVLGAGVMAGEPAIVLPPDITVDAIIAGHHRTRS